MAYERYPRDELSGDEFRTQGGDRNRRYGARDDAGFGGQGYAGDRFPERGGSYQRGYYSQGTSAGLSERGTRYGGRYGDDYASRGDYDSYSVAGSGNRGSYAGDRGDDGRTDYGRNAPGRGDFARNDAGRQDYGRPDMYRGQRGQGDYDYNDRGFLSRAGDEVRSWFGDDEAERRREMDQRYDQQNYARGGDARDEHYHSWRSGQIAALDRDYDEYRRENQAKFHSEFDTWRSDRQGQRSSLSKVGEHMDVVGSDGEHVGTVDKVRGDRIILTKSDADAGNRHHSIPSRWIETVDDKVTLRKSASEAKSAWRDEERQEGERSAFFGTSDADSNGHMLNRSFSGTYRR